MTGDPVADHRATEASPGTLPEAAGNGFEDGTRWALIASAWSVYALYYLGRVNFSVAVPRLDEQTGLDPGQIGALAAGFFWVYSLSAVPIGRLADRYGARWLVGIGLVGSGLMNLLFVVVSGSFMASLVVWSINGVFQAMGWTPLAGGLGRWVSDERAARVIASFGSCFVAGTALTFAIGGLIVDRAGVDAVFLAAAGVLTPLGIIWWIGVRDPVTRVEETRPERGSMGRTLWLLPTAAAIGIPYVALIVWTPAYFVEVHALSVGRAGLLSAALPAVSIAAILLLGRWFRASRGSSAVLKGGIMLTITSALLFAVGQSPDLPAGFAAIALSTALVGASSSLVLGLFPRMTASKGLALGSGLFALAFNLGGSASSPIVGRFVGGEDWDLVFAFLAGCVLVGGLWSFGWYAHARRVGWVRL